MPFCSFRSMLNLRGPNMIDIVFTGLYSGILTTNFSHGCVHLAALPHTPRRNFFACLPGSE